MAAVTVHTKITNKSRNPYTILVSRDRTYRLRGGETITLDYDLWSHLSKFARRNMERDVAKGILEVNTKIYSDKVSMEVDNEGNVLLSKDTPESDKENIMLSSPTLPPTKSTNKLGTMTDRGVVVARSANNLKEAFGAVITDYNAEDEVISVPDRNGMEKVAQPVSGLFSNNKDDKVKVQATSVFEGKKEKLDEAPTKEATNEELNKDTNDDSTEEDNSKEMNQDTSIDSTEEDNNTDGLNDSKEEPTKDAIEYDSMTEDEAKEVGEEVYINWLYKVDTTTKKYKKIVDYLGDRYPDTVFTKAQVKNFSNYTDLKNALNF